MGSKTPSSYLPPTSESHDEDAVLDDLTIIQAQAQLLMRRIGAERPLDPDDVHQRLAVIVDAVHRLTERHR